MTYDIVRNQCRTNPAHDLQPIVFARITADCIRLAQAGSEDHRFYACKQHHFGIGFEAVPPASIDAVIALSIIFAPVEIVDWRQGREGVTRRKPRVVAFLFGLLHGLGFAGASTEIGLPGQIRPQ